MNLGVIHILSFGAIVVASFVISFAVASTIRWWRVSWPAVVYATLPLWLAIGFFMLDVFHHRLFVVWHRYQNEAYHSKDASPMPRFLSPIRDLSDERRRTGSLGHAPSLAITVGRRQRLSSR